MWICSVIPLANKAFIPNHFNVLHEKLKSVVDLTFISGGGNDDDPAAAADDDDDDDNMMMMLIRRLFCE